MKYAVFMQGRWSQFWWKGKSERKTKDMRGHSGLGVAAQLILVRDVSNDGQYLAPPVRMESVRWRSGWWPGDGCKLDGVIRGEEEEKPDINTYKNR